MLSGGNGDYCLLGGNGDDTLAGEVTQAAFLILAQKAGRLSAKTILTGWLYQTARLTAANALKENRRRQQDQSKHHPQR